MTNPLTQSDLLDTLRRIVGEANVITDAAEVAAASLDGRGRRQGAALAVVRPGSTEETAAVMKTAARAGFTVIAQGGNTSNVGGATPEPGASADEAAHTLILQTGRMRRILAVDPVNNTVTVEAGAVLQTVQEAAAAHHRLFPLSLAAEGSCQIGGVIATNAGGVHVLRYGSARRMVLGLKVVLASGDVLDLMRGLRKDNAGYALKELFIGSEGTLGIITEAILTLEPEPKQIMSGWAVLSELESVETLFDTLESAFGPGLTAFELIGRSPLESLREATGLEPPVPTADWQVLFDVSEWREAEACDGSQALENALMPLIENGTLSDAAVSQSDTDREAFWHCRETIPSAVKRLGGNVKHDISVPRSKLVRFIRETSDALRTAFPGVEPSIFGHYGDGNLHFNVGPKAVAFPHEDAIHRLVHDRVTAADGSIAAEHGVGSLKTDELVRLKAPEELAAMRTLKRAFDPDNRLNPERVIRL